MGEVTTDVSCNADCSEDDADTTFWQETGVHILMTYFLPVVIFVGVTGNLMTLAVVFSKQFRKSPSSLILGALALTDAALLLIGLRQWLIREGFAPRESGEALCKVRTYFFYLLRLTSPALLVILTVERAISVFFPFKCKEMCSRRRILLSVITVVLVYGLANIFTGFAITQVELDSGRQRCLAKPEYQYVWDKVWFWIEPSLGIFVPFILILIGNILIVTKLYTSRKKLSMESTAEKRTSSVTVMLIAVSACFLVLNIPNCVFFIGYIALDLLPTATVADLLNQSFFYHLMIVSSYVNNAINFIMYCLTGSKFRGALKDLFAVCKPTCKFKLHAQTSESSIRSRSVKSSGNTNSTSMASNATDITKT